MKSLEGNVPFDERRNNTGLELSYDRRRATEALNGSGWNRIWEMFSLQCHLELYTLFQRLGHGQTLYRAIQIQAGRCDTYATEAEPVRKRAGRRTYGIIDM